MGVFTSNRMVKFCNGPGTSGYLIGFFAKRTIIFCFNPIRRKPTHHGKVGVMVGTTQRIGFF